MTDDQRRAHADVQPGSVLEFAGYQLARSIGNRHQTLNEQSRNAGNQFHDGSHLYAQHQNLGQFVTGKHPYQAPHYDAQKQRLAQQAKAFLQTFGINLYLVHAGYLIQHLVDGQGKGYKPRTKRLGNGYAIHLLVKALKLLRCHICND